MPLCELLQCINDSDKLFGNMGDGKFGNNKRIKGAINECVKYLKAVK